MHILALEIYGFRGIQNCRLTFPDQVVLIGPNGSGKSTIIDALSLVFGRQKLVRDLTQHDFTGSCPRPEDRIRIVVTLGGFSPNTPVKHPNWFRFGRAVVKWWNPSTYAVNPVEVDDGELCVQIGYAARFDYEDLRVKQRRYFHDDDEVNDPFDEDAITYFPDRLLNEIGYFVLPPQRTWPATISFGSELFRKAVATFGGIPATSILSYLNELRTPKPLLEDDPDLKPLVDNINRRIGQLIPGNPQLQLRLTSTDTDSLLRALVPHFCKDEGYSLPAVRQGTGLLSLQTLILLLEIGRARNVRGDSFILALEEPELHVPPGLQRRLIGDAAAVSNQIICTTHAPRVAAFFDASCIQLLTRVLIEAHKEEKEVEHLLEGRPLAPTSMVDEPNALIQLYSDQRMRLVEALMFPRILIPEGRIDFEWLRLLLDIAETGARSLDSEDRTIPPYGSVVGVIPTRDSSIKITYERLATLHPSVAVLLDGDAAGDAYVTSLLSCDPQPVAIIQWPSSWTIEDIIGWCIDVDKSTLMTSIQKRLNRQYDNHDELITALKSKKGDDGGLKSHYMAHEEIAAAMKCSRDCVKRVELVLEALTRVVVGELGEFPHLEINSECSQDSCPVYRFLP